MVHGLRLDKSLRLFRGFGDRGLPIDDLKTPRFAITSRNSNNCAYAIGATCERD